MATPGSYKTDEAVNRAHWTMGLNGKQLIGSIGSCSVHLPRNDRDRVPAKAVITSNFFGDPPAGRPRPGESPQAWNDNVRAQLAA